MANADDPTAGTAAWLEGLAGRAAQGQPLDGAVHPSPDPAPTPETGLAHSEGRQLRAALMGDADATSPVLQPLPAIDTNTDAQWQALLQRARPPEAANQPVAEAHADTAAAAVQPPPPVATAQPVNRSPAAQPHVANRPLWTRPAWRTAAGVGALAVLLKLVLPAADDNRAEQAPEALRGGGDGSGAAGGVRWFSAQPAQDAQQLVAALQAAGAQTQVQALGASVQIEVQAGPPARAATNAVLARLDTALNPDGRLQLLLVPAVAPAPR